MNFCTVLCHPKLLFVATALLTAPLASFGQMNVVIAPNKLNVLFIGVDNPVSVAASGAADNKVSVSISGANGTVAKIGAGLYNVRVSSVTDECTLAVYVDGKLAGSSGFRVRSLPAPTGRVGGYQSGANIPADAFRTQAGVGVYVKDFPFEVRYEVLGFIFSINDEKGGVQSAICQGNFFSAEAKQYLDQNAKPGRTVTIDSIRVKDPSGRELKIPAIVYFLK